VPLKGLNRQKQVQNPQLEQQVLNNNKFSIKKRSKTNNETKLTNFTNISKQAVAIKPSSYNPDNYSPRPNDKKLNFVNKTNKNVFTLKVNTNTNLKRQQLKITPKVTKVKQVEKTENKVDKNNFAMISTRTCKF
jgi:hypothetical protein